MDKTISERIIEVIKEIPKGHVLSYKEVGELAGHPNAARLVARLLSNSSYKHNLPWWRVVNSKLEISIKNPSGRLMQKELLESEGIVFINGKIHVK